MMENEKSKSIQLADELYEWINEYNLACTAEKDAKKRKNEAKFYIVDALGENNTGVCVNTVITNKVQEKITIDTKMFEKEHPELFKKYAKKTTYSVMRLKAIEV